MNTHMAWWIVDQLVQQGVCHFFLAPGSRSTPLALAAAHHPKAHSQVHYDERGLGFFALGAAKASQNPSAIIVTSGTAVGNLLPSVMEAYHSYTPLILLTADRPPELQQAGANQVCDQMHIFGRFVRGSIYLPTADAEVTQDYVRSSLAQAVCLATEIPGPVQVNWHIREPLFPPLFPFLTEGKPIRLTTSRKTPLTSTPLSGPGVIAIGKLPNPKDLSPILQLAKELRWPVFADLLSESRFSPTKEQILHFDWICKKTPSELEPETVLHFGERLTSKAFLSFGKNPRRIHVSPYQELQDPERKLSERVIADIEAFCESAEKTASPESWLNLWKNRDEALGKALKMELEKSDECTEAGAFYKLSQHFDSKSTLYLGSGMPIRDANLFFFPQEKHMRVFCNRGLSGIDGNIATAAGLAEGLKSPLLAWIGDQAALYDLNSLSLLKAAKYPILLIISNNFGGGIFSHLPIAKATAHFEKLWANAHNWEFFHAAKLFDLPYTKVESLEELTLCYEAKKNSTAIIELITSRETNYAKHQSLQKKLSELYCARSSCVNFCDHHNSPSFDDPSSAILMQYGSPHDRRKMGHSEAAKIHTT